MLPFEIGEIFFNLTQFEKAVFVFIKWTIFHENTDFAKWLRYVQL